MTRTPVARGRAAVAAWEGRLAAVLAEPTEENLQRLCTLLDAIDAWVVKGWDKKGHDERMATLGKCRVGAWQANQAVTAATRNSQALRGQAAAAARKRNARAVTSSAGLGAPVGGDAA